MVYPAHIKLTDTEVSHHLCFILLLFDVSVVHLHSRVVLIVKGIVIELLSAHAYITFGQL